MAGSTPMLVALISRIRKRTKSWASCFLSLSLSLVLCVCMIPVPAFAEEDAQEETSPNLEEFNLSHPSQGDEVAFVEEHDLGTADASTPVWSLSNGTLRISGIGVIDKFDPSLQTKRNSINTLVIEEGITGIGESVFADCNLISSVSLPESLHAIGGKNFKDCWSLTSINLPSQLEELGPLNFQNCNRLTSVTIPASITKSAQAFYGCTSLESVILEEGFAEIGERMFYGCEKLTTINYPEGLNAIGDRAFQDCTKLTTLKCPSSLRYIGISAFQDCDLLATISLNEGLESIGTGAFRHMVSENALTEVTVPSTVTTIGDSAFEGQAALEDVTILGCLDMGKGVFRDLGALRSVTLGGAGAQVVVGNNAFQNCANLRTLQAHEGLLAIGVQSFYKCSTLQELALPQSCTSVGKQAFYGCSSLKSADLPSLRFVADDAFGSCNSLSSVQFGLIEGIGDGAFEGCAQLKAIVLPATVESVFPSAFSGLESVEFKGSAPAATGAIAGSSTRIIYPANDASWTKSIRKTIASDANNMYIRNKDAALVKAPYISPFQEVAVPFGSSRTEVMSSEALKGNRSFEFTVPQNGKVRIAVNYRLPCYHGSYFITLKNSAGIAVQNAVTLRTSQELVEDGYYALTPILSAGDYHLEVIYAQSHSGKTGMINVGVYPEDQGSSTGSSQTMYRLYNPNSGEHFYTAVAAERDNLVSVGWNYEGTAWNAPASGQPVYRMYNANAGDHHYTPNAGERDALVAVGWNYEGVGWYSDTAKKVPLYRLYNPNAIAGSHHYTTNAGERDNLVSVGWQDEGIGWYGM